MRGDSFLRAPTRRNGRAAPAVLSATIASAARTATRSTASSSASNNGSNVSTASKKKMKPTRTSPKKRPPAKSAPPAEDGNIRPDEDAALSLPKKKRRPARKPAKPKSKKDAATRASPSPPPEQKGVNISRTRVRMDEALREEGLDEHKVAKILAGVVNRVEGKTDPARVDDKLLLDVVKVVNPQLEPARRAPAAAAAASETRVIVNLIHEVARPSRPTPASIAAADEATVAPSEVSPL